MAAADFRAQPQEDRDATAAIIKDAGGTAIALRVDHRSENDVKALFRRILRAHKRIDIIVDACPRRAFSLPLRGAGLNTVPTENSPISRGRSVLTGACPRNHFSPLG